MKKIVFLCCLVALSQLSSAQTWDEWFRQDKTQLDYLKKQLVKLQLYLGYLKKGYGIVQEGLTTIGDLKNGDFGLHQDFFDRRQQVNPVIRKYAKVATILGLQKQMRNAYKKYRDQFRESGVYDAAELSFLLNLLTTVLDRTANDLDELRIVVSDGQLEMQDHERIRRIDQLCERVTERHAFFFSFCKQTEVHVWQRKRELEELKNLKKIF